MNKIIEDYKKIVAGNEAGKNICFISRGEYADPEIAYNGILMNYWDVYDCMDEVERDISTSVLMLMRSRRIQWNGCRVHDAASGLWSGSSITGEPRRADAGQTVIVIGACKRKVLCRS